MNASTLLQRVTERILMEWLVRQGRTDVRPTHGMHSFGGRSVDVTCTWQGTQRHIKVKPDPYFGVDPIKIADRSLVFYRADANAYAFESVANTATREPGWMFESSADELYYYFVAIGQTQAEIAALLSEPDEVFFSEIAIERDELVIFPMHPTIDWFGGNFERYTSRPVTVDGASAWCRVVPRVDIDSVVPGLKRVGSVVGALRR